MALRSAGQPAVLVLQSLWLPVVLLAGWQAGASWGWVNAFFFPPPTLVLETAWKMTVSGELPGALGATMKRYSVGVLLGCLAGVACGLLMGTSVIVRRALGPFIAALYSTPKLALLPLVMLLLGIGNASKILMIALVGFIFMATQTFDAVRGVDPAYIESARNHRAGGWAVVRRVYLPATLPQMFTGLRIALTRSLVVAISVELVSGVDGLGAIIWLAWETLTTERLYVGIFLASGLGVLVHGGLARLERLVVPWRA